MKIAHSKSAFLLVIGDIVTYFFSLILALTIRYGELPDRALMASHIPSFIFLIAAFILVSFSAGLFDKQFSFMRARTRGLLIKVQIANIFIGIAFFYLAPVAIAPKANLIIYFVVSTGLLFIWRMIMFPVFSATRIQPAILIGSGNDIQDLYEEVNGNVRYGLTFKEVLASNALADQTVSLITNAMKRTSASLIIADLGNPLVEAAIPSIYPMIFSGVKILNARRFYESIFDRIPLSMVGERWFVESASTALGGRHIYDTLKRLMDIIVAGVVGIISLILYPFVYAAIKLDDGGSIFIAQERIGKNGKLFRIVKFRSMTSNDGGSYETNNGKTSLEVTRVGTFIRMTRIDELPQLWSVLKGDQSLIGPRPELPPLVSIYEKEIPYYGVRHLIKPGLSGWAQIYHERHPHHGVNTEEARNKLSYDLYYIKNRSFGLDIRIALQTMKALLSRQGI